MITVAVPKPESVNLSAMSLRDFLTILDGLTALIGNAEKQEDMHTVWRVVELKTKLIRAVEDTMREGRRYS